MNTARTTAALLPKPGNYIKLLLPGETPWALVLRVTGGRVLVAIDNRLLSPLHGWNHGDMILVEKGSDKLGPNLWVPIAEEKIPPLSAEEKSRREVARNAVFNKGSAI